MKLNPLASGKLAGALLLPVFLGLSACRADISLCRTELSCSDLDFASLASIWDEGMPLGNATVGALVWQRDSALRFSLDRIDLWDLRPMEGLPVGEKDFGWGREHIRNKDYSPVQELFDRPYNVQPVPSKIPGAAMEFPLSGLGEPAGVHLYLDNALCEVSWADGRKMQTFVHASEPVGWFVFEGAPDGLEPRILAPAYHKAGISDASADPVSGQDLERLGYVQGTVSRKGDMLVYHQEGYGDYSYAWYANMQARAFNGEEAAEALRTFADCFCLRNTFHANGDQSGTGKSKFDYRPFTLEGNFAFASGVQEMLLQSHTGTIRVFPAIPEDWKDVSFSNLRAMGAFLVSAERRDGEVTRLGIYSEKGGRLSVLSPVNGELLEFDTEPGQRIEVL